ncbi:GNAT family N-acetyltransferase [Ilumatobacter sp.]|uniref:GNAT family N-acetyltransferase n=1 Tax=Ilumatobacter sp. TaxID=1967498 RepID=UPI003B51CB44
MSATADHPLLAEHLRRWVGAWPAPSRGVRVVGDAARSSPTWDGSVRPLRGVGEGTGAVVAVPPAAADLVARAVRDDLEREGLGDELGEILGVGPAVVGRGVFRSTAVVASDVDDLGEWFDRQSSELPAWLEPFNGPRLVARGGDGSVLGAVGIKVHDSLGHELAVVTEERARGRGIARRLVATAARRVLDDGAVPTYLHAHDNVGSARVADAVGFADVGRTVIGLWPAGS